MFDTQSSARRSGIACTVAVAGLIGLVGALTVAGLQTVLADDQGHTTTIGHPAVKVEPTNSPMHRDAKAEEEVLAISHAQHQAFDSQDIDAIARTIADEEFLLVFEMTPDGKPIKIQSKKELIDWLRSSFADFSCKGAKTAAKNPVMHVRATSNFAIVTEECGLKVQLPDGKTQLQTLRATSVARKGSDGWKFIHWHMSPGAPRTILDAGQDETRAAAAKLK